jgi:hypothetical protein
VNPHDENPSDEHSDDEALSRMLAAERRAPGPSAAQRQRMALALRERIGEHAGSGMEPVRPRRRPGRFVIGAPLLLVGAVGAAAAAGWWVTTRNRPQPPVAGDAPPPVATPTPPETRREPPRLPPAEAPSIVPSPTSRAPAPLPDATAVNDPGRPLVARRPVPERSAPAPKAASPATAAASTPAPPSAPDPSALERERALLATGRVALQRGDLAGARRTIDAHAEAHPAGQLVEARRLLEIQLLVREGRREAAQAAAERFRQQYPTSLFGPALEDALRAAAPGETP